MAYPYCELFDFDYHAIQLRLSLMDMGERDVSLAVDFHQRIIIPHREEIVDRFYTKLEAKPQFLSILSKNGVDEQSLRQTQSHYLDTLGIGFNTHEYFEDRLKIGWIHLKVGVPLSLYQSAYRILQEIFIDRICASIDSKEERMSLIGYILRVSNLDMSLAITAYHHAEVNELERSLQHVQHKHEILVHKASTDALTGLPMRDVINQRLQQELSHRIEEINVHLIMADLDFFKQVNDQYGHLAGDEVLKGVAARIRQSLRGSDTVGRYGGEEFIIMLKGKSDKQALQIAERIRQHVASTPINAQGHQINISLSQGVTRGLPSDSIESLVDRADKALYDAKHSGRNCVRSTWG